MTIFTITAAIVILFWKYFPIRKEREKNVWKEISIFGKRKSNYHYLFSIVCKFRKPRESTKEMSQTKRECDKITGSVVHSFNIQKAFS